VIVDVSKGKVAGPAFWHRDGVLDGSFSPDGVRLITGGEDRDLLVWNSSTATELLPPLHHHQQVHGVAFSPDGRRIGSISSDEITRVWDSETGFPLTPPLACERNQMKIIFLPDPLRFATVQNPTRTWLWTLPRTSLSPEDAVAVSHLLNADLRSPGPNDTREIAESWSRLKRKFPDLFQANEKQIVNWHQKQYRLAESMKMKSAMAFHRERLDALEGGSRASDNLPTRLPQAAFAKTSN
jgi:WD40 repeat protein